MGLYDVGTVFCQNVTGKRHYWKITGSSVQNKKTHYDVVACSKGGKEYRSRNGFWNIDQQLSDPSDESFTVVTSVSVPAKASIDAGVLSGKKKRRLKHLRAVVLSAQKEIDQLIKDLSDSEVFVLFIKTLSDDELESLYWVTKDTLKRSNIKVELGFRMLSKSTTGSEE
ncbi:MAG: hypothetical protein WC477_06910 [Patescibacteria group bacterium]